LQAFRHKPVGSLAYGIQKRVELGRALAVQPSLLLLDEPMAGMNSEEKEDMARYVLDVHELAGVTVILIEHDMAVVMDISDRVSVLDFGRLIADGTPDEVKAEPGRRRGLPRGGGPLMNSPASDDLPPAARGLAQTPAECDRRCKRSGTASGRR
jgi:energy-coupling factor transporter ATP-binding protein EcfA2